MKTMKKRQVARQAQHMLTIAALTCATWLALGSAPAHAGAPIRQGGNLGIGLSSSGLSLKYFLSDGQALQATLGFGIGLSGPDREDRFFVLRAGVDYLLELPEFYQGSILNIGPAIGLGASVGMSNNYLGAAVSGVGGIEFNFNPIPIDLVLEWRPTLNVIPDVGVSLIAFMGHIRYYF